MKDSVYKRWLLLVLVLGLVARLVVIHERLPRPLQGDELSYDSIAGNLVSGHGYSAGAASIGYRPTALRGPGYVLFLAGHYRVFGHDRVPPMVVQAVLDLLAALLLARLALLWFARASISLVAAALHASYPPFMLDTALIMTETVVRVAIVACVYLYVEYLRTKQVRPLVLAGIALGVGALAKPQFALIGIVLGLSSMTVLSWRTAARAAAILTVVVGLVMTPWMVRNLVVLRAFIPGVSMGGTSLWLGAGPYGGHDLGATNDPAIPDSVRAMLGTMSELELNAWAAREAPKVIRANPAGYVRLAANKMVRLWFNIGFPDHPPSRASWLVALFNATMIVLAIGGARLARPAPPAASVLVGLALFWCLVHAPFFAVVRYAHPYYALLFGFSAAGIVEGSRFLPTGRRASA